MKTQRAMWHAGVAILVLGIAGAAGPVQAEAVTVPNSAAPDSVAPAAPGSPGPAGPTPSTPPEIRPKSKDGSVIAPPKDDTRMPVIRPSVPSRMPVIHPESGAAPGSAAVVPK